MYNKLDFSGNLKGQNYNNIVEATTEVFLYFWKNYKSSHTCRGHSYHRANPV